MNSKLYRIKEQDREERLGILDRLEEEAHKELYKCPQITEEEEARRYRGAYHGTRYSGYVNYSTEVGQGTGDRWAEDDLSKEHKVAEIKSLIYWDLCTYDGHWISYLREGYESNGDMQKAERETNKEWKPVLLQMVEEGLVEERDMTEEESKEREGQKRDSDEAYEKWLRTHPDGKWRGR